MQISVLTTLVLNELLEPCAPFTSTRRWSEMNRLRNSNGHRNSNADRRGEARTIPPGAPKAGRNKRFGALIPLLMFAAFAALIASQEIPAFANLLERVFQPAKWQTKTTCHDAALAELPANSYARLLDGGSLHRTADGPSVTGIRFTMLDQEGGERNVTYDCYLSTSGKLHRLTLRTP